MTRKFHPPNPGYEPGNNWDTCQRCGVEHRQESMLLEWNGLRVCETCWEPRHPQDFLRVHEEKIVPDWQGVEDPTNLSADQASADEQAAKRAADPDNYEPLPGTFNPNTL